MPVSSEVQDEARGQGAGDAGVHPALRGADVVAVLGSAVEVVPTALCEIVYEIPISR